MVWDAMKAYRLSSQAVERARASAGLPADASDGLPAGALGVNSLASSSANDDVVDRSRASTDSLVGPSGVDSLVTSSVNGGIGDSGVAADSVAHGKNAKKIVASAKRSALALLARSSVPLDGCAADYGEGVADFKTRVAAIEDTEMCIHSAQRAASEPGSESSFDSRRGCSPRSRGESAEAKIGVLYWGGCLDGHGWDLSGHAPGGFPRID